MLVFQFFRFVMLGPRFHEFSFFFTFIILFFPVVRLCFPSTDGGRDSRFFAGHGLFLKISFYIQGFRYYVFVFVRLLLCCMWLLFTGPTVAVLTKKISLPF